MEKLNFCLKFYFFKYVFYFKLHVWVCIYMPPGQRKVSDPLKLEVTGGCEPDDMGAGS